MLREGLLLSAALIFYYDIGYCICIIIILPIVIYYNNVVIYSHYNVIYYFILCYDLNYPKNGEMP